jgi:predicted DNA-binding transcriptional regulator YafY
VQRAERLLDMIQSLRRRRRPVTAETLAAELNVSVRTVYRDIGALVRQGVPVRGEAGIGYVLDAGFDLPPLMLSPDEIEAVLVGMRWLTERADPTLARAAEDVVSKVAAVLPSHLKPILLDGALFAASYPGDLPVDRVDIGPVRAAIRNGRKLSIHYSDESGQATQRQIWPIGMTFYERVRVVIAWCELRQAFRHFRTDRITELAALEERYPGRRADLFRRWQKEEEAAREEWARCQREGRGDEASAAADGAQPRSTTPATSLARPEATSASAAG